jgi:hypothetical protein
MRAGDTNLLVRDDAAQTTAAETFVENGAWVSQLVLAETLWMLDAVYERTSAPIARVIDLLLNHKHLDPGAFPRPSFAGFLRLSGAGNRAQGWPFAPWHVRQASRQAGRCCEAVNGANSARDGSELCRPDIRCACAKSASYRRSRCSESWQPIDRFPARKRRFACPLR